MVCVRIGETLHVISGCLLDDLRASDRSTGEVMYALLKENKVSPDILRQFQRCVRIPQTDRYEPNKIGERALLASSPFFSLLHIFCHCHILVTGMTLCTKLLPAEFDNIRGYIAALRAPGQMAKFFAAARSVLWDKLEVGLDFPEDVDHSGDAERFRMMVIDVVLPDTSSVNRTYLRKFVLRVCAHDWRHDRFRMKTSSSKDAAFR